ncbi:MAG: hypothetical protein KGY67_06685 [Candidatus Thermoplasmatota archaeon]|nr:hypothetical protein [Candidatus Thermoplasmatota archaeon]
MLILAIILAFILGLVQFFSEQIVNTCGKYYTHVLSFSAGISVTYLFVDLFPAFSINAVETNQFLFVTVLIGFIFIHLIEKYVYQHSKDDSIDDRLEGLNQFTSVFYHVVLGVVIFDFSEKSIIKALLLFVPIVIFTGVSTLPVRRHSSSLIRFFVSLSTLVGVIVAWVLFDYIQGFILSGLIGFVIGGLLFSVIRHSIPHGKKGKPLFFVIGVLVYTPIVLWTLLL